MIQGEGQRSEHLTVPYVLLETCALPHLNIAHHMGSEEEMLQMKKTEDQKSGGIGRSVSLDEDISRRVSQNDGTLPHLKRQRIEHM